MQWYTNDLTIDGIPITIEGTYEDSTIRITAILELDPTDITNGYSHQCLFEKPVNMWSYQDVLIEDILCKYIGKIKKIEHNLSTLVQRIITQQDVFKISGLKSNIDKEQK